MATMINEKNKKLKGENEASNENIASEVAQESNSTPKADLSSSQPKVAEKEVADANTPAATSPETTPPVGKNNTKPNSPKQPQSNQKGNQRNARGQSAQNVQRISEQKEQEIYGLAGQVKRLKSIEQALFWKMVGVTPMQTWAYLPEEGRVAQTFFQVDADLLSTLSPVFQMAYGIAQLRKAVGEGSRLAATPRLSRLWRESQSYFDRNGEAKPPILFEKIIEDAVFISALCRSIEREANYFRTTQGQRDRRSDLKKYEARPDALVSEDYTTLLKMELDSLLEWKKDNRLPFSLRPMIGVLKKRLGIDSEEVGMTSNESGLAESSE